MKYNHVMRTSCLAALICLSLSAVSLANGPVTDSAKASDPAFSVPVVSNPIPNEAIKDLEIVEDQGSAGTIRHPRSRPRQGDVLVPPAEGPERFDGLAE